MEKFAIDLDKVLDDFEFNEDCAEQIASVNSPVTIASSSTNKCTLEASTPKAYNYLMIDHAKGKTSNEFDIIPSIDKCKDSQPANTENNVCQNNVKADNLNYNKTGESSDSINHFYMHDAKHDSKLTQKQTGLLYDSEQVSLTMYNDVSQKLLQKQQNGNSSPKVDNRYDKKLSQPNIKPSVSNVFNSLNEYINAPPGSLDYIHTVLDEDITRPNIEPNDVQDTNETSSNNTTENYTLSKTSIKGETSCIPEVEQTHKDALTTIGMLKESCMAEHENTEARSTIVSHLTHCSSAGDDVRSINVLNAEQTEDRHHSRHISITAISARDPQCKYDDPVVDVTVVNPTELNTSVPPKCEVEHRKSSFSSLSGNSNKEESLVQQENQNPTVTHVHIQQQETEVDSKLSEVITETSNENTLQLVTKGYDVNTDIEDSGSTHKPVGFNNIDDLSEEELRQYLAEIEEEERLNEACNAFQNKLIPDPIVKTGSSSQLGQNHGDEDAREAPIFESVTIGELPKISQEQLSEKAKKFPVIDYSKKQNGKQQLENMQDNISGRKIMIGHMESPELSIEQEEKYKGINTTSEDYTSDDGIRIEVNQLSIAEGSHSRNKENIATADREDVPESKSISDIDECCMYGLTVKQDSLNNVKTEVQLKGDEKATFNSTEYNENSDLNAQNDLEVTDQKNLVMQVNKIVNDNTKHSTSTLSKNVEHSVESSITKNSDEDEKPVRPQTLDIFLSDNVDEHQATGSNAESSSVTPSGPMQAEIDGMRDDCQGSSPDVLENTLLESNSILGKQAPFWVPDSDAPSCMLCDVKFTVLKRRHHCRACGKVLCNKCCNMKYKLQYQGNIDSRVCVSCYQLLTKAESEQGMSDWSSGYTGYMSNSDINSPQGRQPNPNNPMEYCSTIPPLQQLAGGLPPPPTVMVPVGVLKREGGTKHRPEGSKSVMFSDGIRPGCDLTELDMSWDLKPPYRKAGNKRISTPGSSLASTVSKKQNMPRLDPNTDSYIPQDPNFLPPTVTIHKGQITYHTITDESALYKTLKNKCEPPVMFAINRNLYAYVKITNLNCCVNKICWNVTSRGLSCVGQDEVILLVETLPDETRIPKDLLIFINQLYVEAIKGNTVSELGFSIFRGGNLLGSREHAGFLFIRQTLQCLQKIALPPAPFLVGLLVHRWETPWAKVFPLRLLLRLGAEYRYYPCPLVSVRFRDALYFEIGHTVMKVLADFRNFGYTLPGVRGLTIHLRNRMTDVMFPRNRYDQVIKGLNNSNDHVLAYASNFSITADSHLVCIQTNHGDESSYQTQAINIHNKPRTVTGASFIVINGALKSSMGLSAKSSIVEDGLMVEIMPEKMEALKAALKNMQDFTIGCGKQGAAEPDETVHIKWVDNDVQFNLGVKSPIDGQPMDGIPSIRVHNGTDYKGTSRFIRWTEVFIIKSDDHPNGVHDPVDINKLSGNIAKATCTALVKLLDLLATAGLTKLGVRTTIHPDNVGYEAGSEGTKLPPIYMNSLDNELIQVLHKAAQNSQDTHTVLELIFYILDD